MRWEFTPGNGHSAGPARVTLRCGPFVNAVRGNGLQGLESRKTFMTNMNMESSRSHAVFLLTISTFVRTAHVTKYSQLYMVDLAGSEKVWKTGAEGDRLEEAKFINKARVQWCHSAVCMCSVLAAHCMSTHRP